MEPLAHRISRTWIQPRNPAVVLVASVLTCGLYQLVWYHRIYEEVGALFNRTPTGNSYWLDLLLTVLTCGVYGIYVDYLLCHQLNGGLAALGHRTHRDDGTVVVVLDVAAYMTGWMSNLVTTALAQDQLNKLLRGGPQQGGAGRPMTAAEAAVPQGAAAVSDT